MELPTDFSIYTQWLGIFTLVMLGLTILAFIFRWGLRFRLVGVTSFSAVLTIGLFGLSLGLATKVEIPGAIRYTLVYDNGANSAVIALPNQVSPNQVEATLKKAAYDLYSYGRIGLGDDKLIVRARTVIHPETGVSLPLYLGEAKRPLRQRENPEIEINLFSESFAKLP